MQPITPCQFHAASRTFDALAPEDAGPARSHPQQPLKSRTEFELDPDDLAANMQHRVYPYPAHLPRDEHVRQGLIKALRSQLLREEHLYLVEDKDLAKDCGYAGYPLSTRGTSVPGRLCFTASLMNCVAVGMKAEVGENGVARPGGKVRITHVYGFSEDEFDALRGQLQKMQKTGKVKVILLGGTEDNEDEVASLKRFLADLDVEIELDKAGTLRQDVGSFLGMAIDELDHSLHYAKGLVTVTFSGEAPAPASSQATA